MAYIDDPKGNYKAIPVATLISLLMELQATDLLAVNTVGNLLIKRDGESWGFVCFGAEEIESWAREVVE